LQYGLVKNWEEILINQLDNKVKVIGTQVPVGSQKPQDFPLMYACLFETNTFKKLNINFCPNDLTIYQDTGWEMREKYLQAGFCGKLLEMRNTRTYKEGPFKEVICGEYYLKGFPQIFASHFGRGSTLGEHKYRKGFGIFYKAPVIGRYLRLKKGRNEKKKMD
jgi:hypothetical protein